HYKKNTAIIRAVVESEMHNYPEAMHSLKVAAANNWLDYKTSLKHPVFEELRDLPEFKKIMEEMKSTSDSLRLEIIIATRKSEGT
ncbi:MAG: hypothetical protein DRI69_05520, partial [Bacteroidetes bacterium]